ncbi:trimeric intracellular cation channel family protein [Pseudonocardia spinosispora]|uniref:trimeric intracellular cation channel family protein n=1 Tax=Pseudonocardia spinosispora TaxID=103441 RepID=UPI00042534C0|nr:trimeric intracellular cation channel family protein [Pseudonocardia spinosispora]
MLLLVLDLLGIAVFAVSGALAAIRARFDVFGVMVLAVITAIGGGVIRDVLLGITPPSSLRRWPYLLVPLLVGLAVFLLRRPSGAPRSRAHARRLVLVADALGLALFVTTGTSTALATGAPAVTSALVGAITGIGGGVLRDILLREVPLVLHREIYAVPALLGAMLVALADRLSWPSTPIAIAAAILVAGLRLLAIWRQWDAPRARL